MEIQNLQDERMAKDAYEAYLFVETTRWAVKEKHHMEAKLHVEKNAEEVSWQPVMIACLHL